MSIKGLGGLAVALALASTAHAQSANQMVDPTLVAIPAPTVGSEIRRGVSVVNDCGGMQSSEDIASVEKCIGLAMVNNRIANSFDETAFLAGMDFRWWLDLTQDEADQSNYKKLRAQFHWMSYARELFELNLTDADVVRLEGFDQTVLNRLTEWRTQPSLSCPPVPGVWVCARPDGSTYLRQQPH